MCYYTNLIVGLVDDEIGIALRFHRLSFSYYCITTTTAIRRRLLELELERVLIFIQLFMAHIATASTVACIIISVAFFSVHHICSFRISVEAFLHWYILCRICNKISTYGLRRSYIGDYRLGSRIWSRLYLNTISF